MKFERYTLISPFGQLAIHSLLSTAVREGEILHKFLTFHQQKPEAVFT